jgi:putative glutamine amidotransferase
VPEAATGFALAVQWHPEWKVMDNDFSRALFAAFGDAARERAARRVARNRG